MSEKNAIVLAADRNYSEQAITLIKSICCYNKNIHFYLVNRDFPIEWFNILNEHLKYFNSEITDIKIYNQDILKFKTLSHISEATYYRYFIPEFVTEDKCIYLDCDIVVNGNLDALFSLDLSQYNIAAVLDPIAKTIHNQLAFNAGVLVINNKKWKELDVTNKLMNFTLENNDNIDCGDQDVLNFIFKDSWLLLNKGFNYQIGVDFVFRNYRVEHLLEDLGDLTPLIVHYTTEAKPWLNSVHTRFRNLYWYYYALPWEQILTNYP